MKWYWIVAIILGSALIGYWLSLMTPSARGKTVARRFAGKGIRDIKDFPPPVAMCICEDGSIQKCGRCTSIKEFVGWF